MIIGNDDWFAALSQRLQQHDIHLTLERGTDATYRAMSQKRSFNDLLFMVALRNPAAVDRCF